MPDQNDLYERIGGEEAIEAAVEEFYDRVLADDRLAPFFDDADLGSLKAHQRAFLATATGGPAEYDGEEMEAAHAHLDVADDDFDRVATHLAETLSDLGVAEADVTAVGEVVESLRDDIVSA